MGKGISLTVGVMCLVSIDKSTNERHCVAFNKSSLHCRKINKSQSMWYPMMITIPLAVAINAISALAEIYFYLLHPLPTLSHRVIFFNFFCVFWNFGFFHIVSNWHLGTKYHNALEEVCAHSRRCTSLVSLYHHKIKTFYLNANLLPRYLVPEALRLGSYWGQ